ncbi:MAG: TetR/AcrR family transcriptional regulator [Hyphomicrobiales bacterium]|nr:TetR/AcrR family transcriptional regulator [Hyphomicrobiales bacterium]
MTRGPDKQFDPDEALEKVMNLFWANGYAATGMSEIQAELGIGRKSLYDTFGCKRTLYIKALEKYARMASARTVNALNRDGPALDQVAGLMRDYADMNAEPGSCGCMLGGCMAEFGDTDTQIAEVVRTHLGIMQDAFFQAFERAKQRDEIGLEDDSRDMARMCVAIIQGLSLVGRTENDPDVTHGIVDATIRLLNRA